MANTYNSLEDYITQLLNRIEIHHPHQLNIETVASRLGVNVIYAPFAAMRVKKTISLDSRATYSQQWQSFCHELCHVLWHYGNQITMPMSWEIYQEAKANNFSQHFCIPSIMLEKIKLPPHEREAILLLQETFNVEWKFATKRLHQYMQNLMYRY